MLYNFVSVSDRQILNYWTIREDPANVGFLRRATGSHILEGTVFIAFGVGDTSIPRLC